MDTMSGNSIPKIISTDINLQTQPPHYAAYTQGFPQAMYQQHTSYAQPIPSQMTQSGGGGGSQQQIQQAQYGQYGNIQPNVIQQQHYPPQMQPNYYQQVPGRSYYHPQS